MLESDERELLEIVVRPLATGAPLERWADLQLRYEDEPWLVDDAIRRKDIANIHDRAVPTIAGLRRLSTPESLNILAAVRKTWEALRARYRKDPRLQSVHATELEGTGTSGGSAAGSYLAVLAASRISGITGWSSAPDGTLATLQFNGTILNSNPFEERESETPMVAERTLEFEARDLRILRKAQWSPHGVSLLAAPNGAGKSSLLEVPMFLRNAYEFGVRAAVPLMHSYGPLRRQGAEGPPEVALSLQVGDVKWTLRLNVHGDAIEEYPGEQVTVGDNVFLRRSASAPDWFLGRERKTHNLEGRSCLRMAVDAGWAEPLAPFVSVLRGYMLYSQYALTLLRDGGVPLENDRVLAIDGRNLFHVLRNWKTAPRSFRNQFDWVLRHLRLAFPGVIDSLEFEPPMGKSVPARFYAPGSAEPLPMSCVADGVLVGLLHLTAVASVPDGGMIAMEEIENQLHPHAIRAILRAMRELAEERNLTILLTTHSPVVMNEFKGHEDKFFIIEEGQEVVPVPLNKARDPEWLAHFSLGDLFDREDFAAPSTGPASPHAVQ